MKRLRSSRRLKNSGRRKSCLWNEGYYAFAPVSAFPGVGLRKPLFEHQNNEERPKDPRILWAFFFIDRRVHLSACAVRYLEKGGIGTPKHRAMLCGRHAGKIYKSCPLKNGRPYGGHWTDRSSIFPGDSSLFRHKTAPFLPRYCALWFWGMLDLGGFFLLTKKRGRPGTHGSRPSGKSAALSFQGIFSADLPLREKGI